MDKNFQTRSLLPFALQRATMDSITFVYSEKSFLDNGSFTTIENEVEFFARVIDLQPLEIQRIREGGITINAGKSVSIPSEIEQVPDYLKYKNELFRVLQFTPREGATTILIDSLPGVV